MRPLWPGAAPLCAAQRLGRGASGAPGSANATVSVTTQSHNGTGVFTQYGNPVAVDSATVTGTTGAFKATADTTLVTTDEIEQVSATASGPTDGTSVGIAAVAIGTTNYNGADYQALAVERGAPLASDVDTVLSNNTGIATAMAASAAFLELGEVGASYSTGGVTTQTSTASISETVNLTLLPARDDLMVGFYGGTTLAGSGVTAVTFKLYVDGVDKDTQSWSGPGAAAAATAYFTDNAVDLGSLALGSALVKSVPNLALKAVMTVTTDAATSGFYGDIIIADAPPATPAAHFVETAAALGAEAGGSMSPSPVAHGRGTMLLTAASHMGIA